MKNRILMLLILSSLSLSRIAVAQNPQYDLPGNDDLPKQKLIDKFLPLHPLDYRVQAVSVRLVNWSEYLGPRNNTKRIAPNRLVWEVLRIYCRPAANGEVRYYFEAFDAVTKERLVNQCTMLTKDISLVSPWANKAVRCSFPGPE